MTNPKPRSRAQINVPPDYNRIKQRIGRLRDCIAKHEKRAEAGEQKSIDKIAACNESIVKYKAMAKELIQKASEIEQL